MDQLYLLLGSNRGDRELMLNKAKDAVSQQIGNISVSSLIYESEPWGFEDNTPFLNQAIKCSTKLSANEVLLKIHQIEEALGRKRVNSGYEPRIIDLDILFYGDKIINEKELTIPHPLLHKRRFALLALNDVLDKSFLHPVNKMNIEAMLKNCEDPLKIQVYKK